MQFRLLETKEDKEAFINKFGQDIYDLFIKSKDRLKNNKISTDITWHTKNTSVEEMKNILFALQQKMGNKDMSKVDFSQKQIPGKYNYLGNYNGYEVYEPLDYISSMALGVNTGWCTTGRYTHYGDPNFTPSEEDAKHHFNHYTSQGIRLIYFLDPKTMYGEIAIAIYPKILYANEEVFSADKIIYLKKTNFEIFNAEDSSDYALLEEIPQELQDKLGLVVEYETIFDPAESTTIFENDDWKVMASNEPWEFHGETDTLYVVIDKNDDNGKYRLHFASETFVDAEGMDFTLQYIFKKSKDLEDIFMPIIKKYLNIDDENMKTTSFTIDEFIDLFDDYKPNNRDGVGGEFCQKIIREMYGIDSELYDEVWDWDWASYASPDELAYTIERLDDSNCKPFTKDQLIALLNKDEDEYEELGGEEIVPFEEACDDAIQAVHQAFEEASVQDTVDDIIDDFKYALHDAGFELNKDKVVLAKYADDIIQDYIDYGEDGISQFALDDFDFNEPYYGWNKITDETFADCLKDRLSEYF